MEGSISVSSAPGEGSTFTFTIRAEKPDDESKGNLGESSDDMTGEESEQADQYLGYSMLLVEDVDINQEIVTALLEPTQLKIDCANNGAEAVRMFKEAPDAYDIIFMDVQMPVMDGFEATRIIRAQGTMNAKTIPIIAMTANVFKEDVNNCLKAGMNSHIGKPVDFHTVLQILRQYLKRT